MLKDRGEVSVAEGFFEKLDRMRDFVASHPARREIIENSLKMDAAFSLKLLQDLTWERLVAETQKKFGP